MSAGSVVLSFGWSTPTLTLRIDDPRLCEALQILYAGHLLPSSTTEDTETFHAFARDGAWLIGSDRSGWDTFATLPDALSGLEYLTTVRLLNHCPPRVHVHAAAASVNGQAIVALGASGAGKSTVATEWALAGLPLLTDDVLLVDRNGKAEPFRRCFSVNVGHGALRDADLVHLPVPTGGLDTQWFDPSSKSCWADPCPIGVLAIIEYRPDTPVTVQSVSSTEMLAHLTASVMPAGQTAAESFDTLIGLVKGSTIVRVTFGNGHAAAKKLADLV